MMFEAIDDSKEDMVCAVPPERGAGGRAAGPELELKDQFYAWYERAEYSLPAFTAVQFSQAWTSVPMRAWCFELVRVT